MKFQTIDKIVRKHLFDNNLPIHYYVECMSHAISCIRELSFDTLKIVNTKRLDVNSALCAELPCDYVDFVGVGIPEGQFLRPIYQRDTISNLANYNAGGQQIKYPDVDTQIGANYGYGVGPFWGFSWYWNIDDLGESRGRWFGANAGEADMDSFKIIRERGVVQFSQTIGLCGRSPVLTYISDGLGCDSATQVDPMAQATIDAYIEWKRDQAQRSVSMSPKADNFGKEWRKLRARRSELTLADIRNILQSNYTLSPKN